MNPNKGFICVKITVTERRDSQRHFVHMLVHCLKGHNSQGWVRQKLLGAWNSIQGFKPLFHLCGSPKNIASN